MSDRRVALLTGATGLLGRELAAELAAVAWDRALVGSDAGRLAGLRTSLALLDDRVVLLAAACREGPASTTRGEISAAIHYLISDAARVVTGQRICRLLG